MPMLKKIRSLTPSLLGVGSTDRARLTRSDGLCEWSAPLLHGGDGAGADLHVGLQRSLQQIPDSEARHVRRQLFLGKETAIFW
jgi:hypothetical protein